MGVSKNLVVRAVADFSSITTQSKKASASMKSMGTAAATAGSLMKKAFSVAAIVAAVRAVVNASKEAVKAYQEEAVVEAKLAQTMKNTMHASAEEVKAIKDLCSAQQALGVIGDDVTMAGVQQLANFTKQSASLKKLIPVMNDMIAAQYGFEASQESAAGVAKMLGKAMNGQTTSLAKLGFQFTDAQKKIMQYGTEEQRAATLADVVSAHVGGMNAALANTPVGRMQQLRNTMGDIKEAFGQAVSTIGTVFLPLLNRVAAMLATIAAWANRVAQAIANIFGKKIKTSTAAVAAGAGGAASSFEDMEDAAKGAGSAAKEAAKSVLSFDILNKLSDNSSSGGGGSGSNTDAGGGGGILDGFGEEEEEAAESSEKLERALQRIKDLIASINFEPLRQAAARVREAFSGLADVISGALSWAFDNVLAPLAHWTIEDALPAGLNLLADVIDLVTAAINAAKPHLKYLWEEFLQPAASWAGETFVNLLKRFSEIVEGLTNLLEGNTSFKEFLDTLTPLETILGSVGIGATLVFGGLTLLNGIMKTIKGTVGLVTTAFTLLSSPIGIAVLAIGGATAAGVWFYKNWDKVKEKVSAAWDAIKTKFAEGKEELSADIENIKSYFAGIPEKWESVKASLAEKWEAVKAKFAEGKQQLQTDIENIKAYFAGLSAKWEGIRAEIAEKWDAVKAKFTEGKEQLKSDIENIKSFFAGLSDKWEAIRAAIAEKWDAVKAKFTEGKDQLQTDIENIKAFFAGLSAKWEGIRAEIATKWDALKQKFTEGRNAIKNVIDRIKSFFEDLKTKWSTIKDQISQKIDELKQKFENFKLAFGRVKDSVVSFAQNLLSGVMAPFNSIISLVNSIASACQTAASWVNSVLGSGGYADQFAERNMEAGGGMWNGIYASGGWPEVGEVFLAREAGPEMVGTIGGRTAVANNDDIVEAVARGVATAVAQVMNSGGGHRSGGSVTLNVNGKEFCRAIFNDMKSVDSEHGISLVNS